MKRGDTNPEAGDATAPERRAPMLEDVMRELRLIRSALAANAVPELLTAKAAAQYLGIGKTKFFVLVSLGLKPVRLPGAGKRWRRRDLQRFVDRLKSD